MSICPKNKSSKARRDKRRAIWIMSLYSSGVLFNKKEIIAQD